MTTDEESARRTAEAKATAGEAFRRGKNGYELIWDELDNTFAILKDPDLDPDTREKEKIYAGALAFALAKINQYQLGTVDLVKKEANERWKMRQGLIPWRPTQGYSWGTEDDKPAWEHPNNEYWRGVQERARAEAAESRKIAEAASPSSGTAPATVPRARGRQPRVFTDKEKAAIRSARAMDFDDETLAGLYKCSVADIKTVA